MRRAQGSGQAPGEARAAPGQGATAPNGLRPEPVPEPPGRTGPAAARLSFVRWTGSARLFAHRLPPTLAGLLRPARRRVRSTAGLLARRWHRSLRLRVIGTTLVVSLAVVVVLGIFLIQQIATGLIVIQMGQSGDYQLRRHLAGRVAAHPVGQSQQPFAGINRVFVVGTYQAAIAAGRIPQD